MCFARQVAMDPEGDCGSDSEQNMNKLSRGRPRKKLSDLSSRSVRRRINEEFVAQISQPAPPPPSPSPPPPSPPPPSPHTLEDQHVSPGKSGDSDDCDNFEESANSARNSQVAGEFPLEVPYSNQTSEGFKLNDPPDLDNESESDEWSDVIEGLQTIHFECDVCISCQCIDCKICFHSDDGNCFHCDPCTCDGCSAAGDDDVDEEEGGGVEDDVEDEEIILSEKDQLALSFRSDLVDVFLKNKLTHVAMTDILGVLRKHGASYLPKNSKTLLKTVHSVVLREVPPGLYWHNGVTKYLVKYASESKRKVINVTFSTDGVVLFRSCGQSFWPLTCMFNNDPQVYLVGLYLGVGKPADSDDFFKDFVEEIIPLCKDGLAVEKKIVTVNVVCGIFDAPAKSFSFKTAGHNSKCGCFKCTVEGKMVSDRMCFSDLNAPLRTNESFVTQQQNAFHKGRTILETIPGFGCISSVPLDYMHLLLLGVMRKLIFLWMGGPLRGRVGARQVREMSDLLISLNGWVPCEFTRRTLRSLQHMNRFTATEFRLLLLYVGIIVFHRLPRSLYEHFLVFHVFTTIFIDSELVESPLLDFAGELCTYFVKSFSDLFGQQYVSHNVHSVIHLQDDVRRFGALDRFSAFPVENFYGTLTKFVRKGEKPLQQVAKRYLELAEANDCRPCRNKPLPEPFRGGGRHSCGILLDGCVNPQYSSYTIQGGFTLSSVSEPDRCCMLDDQKIVLIQNFASTPQGQTVVIGREFLVTDDVYTFPCSSSVLGISHVRKPSTLKVWPASKIIRKYFRMPWKHGFVVIPLHKQ